MKHLIKIAFGVLITSFLYISCIDEIQFDIDSEQPSTVVEGLISTELKEYTIFENVGVFNNSWFMFSGSGVDFGVMF